MSEPIVRALRGTLRFAQGDAGALEDFETDIAGFFRSFLALALCAPLYLVIVLAGRRMDAAQLAAQGLSADALSSPPGVAFFAVEGAAYLISWMLWPIAMIFLAQLLLLRERYIPYIVAYNWCTLVALALQMPGVWLYLLGAVNLEIAASINLFALGAAITYRWFVTKVALATTGTTAFGLVLIDILLGIFVTLGADRLKDFWGIA